MTTFVARRGKFTINQGMTIMKKTTLVAAALATLAVGSAAASDKTDVLAVIQHQMDSFNKGDMAGVSGVCADDAVVIDNIPPHVWQGPGACAKWAADLVEFVKKNDMTDGVVTLGKAKHVDITGDRAYVVVAAGYKFKMKGKPMSDPGQLTYALQKTGSGWRISGSAWADQ